MRSFASRAQFHIRKAELCGQSDPATRQKIAALRAWVNAEAARVSVSPAALSDAANEATAHVDSRYRKAQSADECQANAHDIATFLDDMIAERKFTQSIVRGLITRAHFQMRMAQLCRQPDEARQKEMASRLEAVLDAYAAEAGVLPDLLRKNATEAAQTAEAAFAQDSSDQACQRNAASLITLSGG